MRTQQQFRVSFIERFIAFVFLITLLPMFLTIAMLIYTTGGEPVILCDEFSNSAGVIARRLRFRTTGHGTSFFRAMGRLLRKYSLDEFPTLWSVVRGDIRLRDLSSNLR